MRARLGATSRAWAAFDSLDSKSWCTSRRSCVDSSLVFGPESFFTDEVITDPFQGAYVARSLRDDLLTDLARAGLAGVPDAESAAALARLLRDELER